MSRERTLILPKLLITTSYWCFLETATVLAYLLTAILLIVEAWLCFVGSFMVLSDIFAPRTNWRLVESNIMTRLSSPHVTTVPSSRGSRPQASPSKCDCTRTLDSCGAVSSADLISIMLPFLRPTIRFPLKKSTLLGKINGRPANAGIADKSINFSSLKLPPLAIDMIDIFWSLDPAMSLLPLVATEVTYEACAFIVFATWHSLFHTWIKPFSPPV